MRSGNFECSTKESENAWGVISNACMGMMLVLSPARPSMSDRWKGQVAKRMCETIAVTKGTSTARVQWVTDGPRKYAPVN